MSGVYSPLISIIIPTYNRANLLFEAVQSVLNQTYQHFELIIVDDHSTDTTAELVTNINDKRIRYIRLDKNQGAPAARNFGIKIAVGELVAFLDSDDQWDFKKLEKQIGVFEKESKNIGIVYTGLKIINNNNEKLITPNKRGDISKNLLVQNVVGTTSSVLIKKDLLDDVGGFDLTFASCQDWDLFIRLSNKAEFDFVEEALVFYFEHDGERISTNSIAIMNGYLKIHAKYKAMIGNLSKSEMRYHYMNIGKYILKAGILSQDKECIKTGRSFLYKSAVILPPRLKPIIFYIYSLNNRKNLLSLFEIFHKMKKQLAR